VRLPSDAGKPEFGLRADELLPRQSAKSCLNDRTYLRGLRELLQKEFLYRSPEDVGTFFVNIRFMFKGDRLAFVKAYHLKDADKQPTLPFPEDIAKLEPPRTQNS
jgi:hypothetical protein